MPAAEAHGDFRAVAPKSPLPLISNFFPLDLLLGLIVPPVMVFLGMRRVMKRCEE